MGSDGFQDLVRRAQEGDRAAMDSVLEVLRPSLERLARPYADPLRPSQSTSDLLQESCLRAWRKIDTFQGGQDDEHTFAMFRSWIGQIVQRLGLDARKRRDRKKRIPPQKLVRLDQARPGETTEGGGGIDLDGREKTPSASARSKEMLEKIRAALDGISDETDGAILRLYFFDGLSLRQIADRIGVHYETVKDRYWATLGRLQWDLKDWL